MMPAVRVPVLLLIVVSIGACAHNPEPQLVETPVRVAPLDAAIAPGDCAEALRRARAHPDLAVDRVATPRTNPGRVLRDRSMPSAVARARYNAVSVTVLVDTTGHTDMSTFRVLKTTHPWLASRLKGVLPKTVFDPALLAGCRVPRMWVGEYSSGTPPK